MAWKDNLNLNSWAKGFGGIAANSYTFSHFGGFVKKNNNKK